MVEASTQVDFITTAQILAHRTIAGGRFVCAPAAYNVCGKVTVTCMMPPEQRRGVAQSGSAQRLGRWGRRFKSSLPDCSVRV